jgi:hypothetical protein
LQSIAFPDSGARPASAKLGPVAGIGLLVGSLAFSLVLAEIGLRILGYKPWAYSGVDRHALNQPDPVLGWTNHPGHFVLPAYAPNGPQIDVTILEDGSRATAIPPSTAAQSVVILGCSLSFGWGLTDAETYPWKLQAAHPELRIVNDASGAQGTLQALLRLERIVASPNRPRLVLYGFFPRHEPRNVATYDWMRGLALNSTHGGVALPYVTLAADGGLVRHPPEAFAVWPLAEHLVTVRVAGDAYMRLVTRGRERDEREATRRLLVEMADVARTRRQPFAVVFLIAELGQKEDYARAFDASGVPWVDCVEPIRQQDKIPVDGHPNGRVHSRWATCLSTALPKLLASPQG